MSTSPEVDAYIAAVPARHAERLSTLRAIVHRVAPDVTETIEWKMPVFKLGERTVCAASRANGVSYYLGEAVAADVIAAVPGMKHGKACLNVGDRVDLPEPVLEAAVRKRLLG